MTPMSLEARDLPSATTEVDWVNATSYWQPAHIVTSAWLEHAPFAFWLVDALRPHRVVELGTHFGFSFFVFAEAARRLGLDTDIVALDTWAGDDHAGFYGEDVFDTVRSIAGSQYADIARLLRGTFAESRPLIADGSVDILHIDGRHGYDDVKEDYEQWRATVRDGGVVLFHDIAERDRGFGVWRLWEEISTTGPSFQFTHGHGLGVLQVGEPVNPRLRQLFEADGATASSIRKTYEALGAVVTRQAELRAMPAEIDSLHEVVDALDSEIRRLKDVVQSREAVIVELQRSTSWKVTRPLRAVGEALARVRREPKTDARPSR